MQLISFTSGSLLVISFLVHGYLSEDCVFGGLESSRIFLLFSILWFERGVMDPSKDLSKVGERILSSFRNAKSLLLSTASSHRPEVPARAAAAAAVARTLAGLPPHHQFSLPSHSEELLSLYGSRLHCQDVEELEDDFYEEEFDPIRHLLEHIPSEEDDMQFFEKQAAARLTQLERVTESLSSHVVQHHEVMVEGMDLIRELEKDLKVAHIISMNGRRHLMSSMSEISRDLVVHFNFKRKQALLDMLPLLSELQHAMDMQTLLESLLESGSFCKAFKVLSEFLQLVDSFPESLAMQQLSSEAEVWLDRALRKLDSLLLDVCQEFNDESYLMVVDAYALIGDISGLAEKIGNIFLQEVLSKTHSQLMVIMQEDTEIDMEMRRFTYNDLCLQIPESKFRWCLLKSLAVLFRIMCFYHSIMNFKIQTKVIENSSYYGVVQASDSCGEIYPECKGRRSTISPSGDKTAGSSSSAGSDAVVVAGKDGHEASPRSTFPWHQLQKDAISFVSQSLRQGRKNLWHLMTTRILVLISSSSVGSMSTSQFLRNYEDINLFILAGEAFCSLEATEFRQRLKLWCKNFFEIFHRQNICALKMVLEMENWLKLPLDTRKGAIFSLDARRSPSESLHLARGDEPVNISSEIAEGNEFSYWFQAGNPFLFKLAEFSEEHNQQNMVLCSSNHVNGTVLEDGNETQLADLADVGSCMPVSDASTANFSLLKSDEIMAQTGSALCLLGSLGKYGKLIQKLEIINVDLFKGMCQLFEFFYYFVFQTFCGPNFNSSGKCSLNCYGDQLKMALTTITQDCDQWIKEQFIPFSFPLTTSVSAYAHADMMSSSQNYFPPTRFGLKERCTGAEAISFVAQVMNRSRAHFQSFLLQNDWTTMEDFYMNVVDSVPDLIKLIYKETSKDLLHINGYVDRIANVRWEVKELGLEHNSYVDLLLEEFKFYKTRISLGEISIQVQSFLLEYGLQIIDETMLEGLSRVKKCTHEGRALMCLDLQVLIDGLQRVVSLNVKQKLRRVEPFVKAYYLPINEFVHWARSHPEYSKSQVAGLINLVASMNSWRRKARLEILEKVESASP